MLRRERRAYPSTNPRCDRSRQDFLKLRQFLKRVGGQSQRVNDTAGPVRASNSGNIVKSIRYQATQPLIAKARREVAFQFDCRRSVGQNSRTFGREKSDVDLARALVCHALYRRFRTTCVAGIPLARRSRLLIPGGVAWVVGAPQTEVITVFIANARLNEL